MAIFSELNKFNLHIIKLISDLYPEFEAFLFMIKNISLRRKAEISTLEITKALVDFIGVNKDHILERCQEVSDLVQSQSKILKEIKLNS